MDLGVLVRQLQGALGGKTLKSGKITVTWAGGVPYADGTVTHGFSQAPSELTVSAVNSAVNANAFAFTPGATTANVRAWTADGTNPAAGSTAQIHWRASL